jgi:hypothetical protein
VQRDRHELIVARIVKPIVNLAFIVGLESSATERADDEVLWADRFRGSRRFV